MIASIHQPHFLPWLGYFNKVLQSDVFIWLHSVQFRKNYFQNRTRIKNVNEQPLWLTLPVHARLGVNIDHVTVADPRWREKVSKTFEQCYGKAPCFPSCWPPLAAAMREASDNLDDVNFRTFRALLALLGVDSVRIARAADLPVQSEDPTGRLVELCSAVEATRYIAGKGGHNYLREDAFQQAGIGVIWQDFDPTNVVYAQLGEKFLPGLSVVDCLFNIGPEQTRELALQAWKP